MGGALKAMENFGGWTTVALVLGAFFTILGGLLVERTRTSEAKTLATKSDEITRLTKSNAELVIGVARDQAKDASTLAAKSDEITGLTKSNAELAVKVAEDQAKAADMLKDKSDQLAAKNDELAQKSDEITRLTKINASIITGGDSYCFLNLLPKKDGQTADLVVEHRGEFPVHDAGVDITDLSDEHLIHDRSNPALISLNRYHFKIGNVVAGSVPHTVGELPLVDRGDLHYVAYIQARNGSLTEHISGTRLESGEWRIKLHVSRLDLVSKEIIVLFETNDSK